MANEPFTWLLTYAVHSTLLLGGAWLLSLMLPDRMRIVRDSVWKIALVGAFVTASFQTVVESAPIGGLGGVVQPQIPTEKGSFAIRLGPPTTETGAWTASTGSEAPARLEPRGKDASSSASGASRTDGCRELAADLRSSAAPVHGASQDFVADASVACDTDAGVDCTTGGLTAGTMGTNSRLDSREAPSEARVGVSALDSDITDSRVDESLFASLASTPVVLSRVVDRVPTWVRGGVQIPVGRPWLLGFGALWALGALLGLARAARTHLLLRRRIRDRVELQSGPLRRGLDRLCARAGVRRIVRLTDCDAIDSPMAIGLAEICVPSRALTDLPREEQQAMLAHELGHLVRRDPLWTATSFWIATLFFFQPLNRLARRRLQHEAEFLSDDWAIEQTGSEFGLARCLATVASWVAGGPQLQTVSPMAGSRSPLVGRVERLLDGRQERPGRLVRWMRIPLAAGLLLTILFLAPEVTARVARPSGATVRGIPSLGGLPLDLHGNADRYTVRFENEDHGDLEVRVEDGDVTRVRLDGETLPEKRYEIDGDRLTVKDDAGDEIFDVDIDVEKQLRAANRRLRGIVAGGRTANLGTWATRALRQSIVSSLQGTRASAWTQSDHIQPEIESAIHEQIDDYVSAEVEAAIDAQVDADVYGDWARSHADAARFDTRALQRRIEEEIQANIAANRWNDDRWSQEWIREQIENGLDAEREALEAELDALREELSSEDRESRREALRDAQSETREILRELRQSREEVLRKLEREVERQTRRSRRETRHSSDVAPHSGSRSTDAGVSGTAVGSAWATAEVATAAESSEAWVSEPAEAGWAAPDPEELESPASPTATPDPTLFAAVVQDAMSALPSTPYSPSPDIRDEDDLGSYPTDLWTAWESDVLRAGGSDHDVLLLSDHDVQTLDLDPGIYVITEDGPTKLVESSSTVVLATPSWRTGGSAGDDGAFALLEDGDVFRLAPLTRRQLKNRLRPSAPLAPAAPSAPSAQVAPLAPLAPRAPFMVTPKTPLAPSAPFMLAPKAPRAPLAELPDVPWVIDGRTIVRQPAGDGIDRETRRSQW